jgi:ornithine cyclodeaminase
MRLVTANDIRAQVQLTDLLEPVSRAFQAYARGISSDAISHLHPDGGEVHIKSGAVRGEPYFVTKISGGFSGNVARGLPVWDGVVVAFDAETGQPVAFLHDEGILTDWRTAAAGAVASSALARPDARTLGVVGTGLQGYWQTVAHCALASSSALNLETVLLWGRDPERTQVLARKLELELSGVRVEACTNLEQLVRESDILVTATGSNEPLIRAEWLRAGQHITALGADNADKRELEAAVLTRADVIVVDSLEVNGRYGEVAAALRDGTLQPGRIRGELGALLSGRIPGRSSDAQVTLVKLVGLGVQDLAAASAVLERLAAR